MAQTDLDAVRIPDGEFTAAELQTINFLSPPKARTRIRRLLEAGRIVPTGEKRRHVGADGKPARGRPATVYRSA